MARNKAKKARAKIVTAESPKANLISPYQKDMKIPQMTASHRPVKEAKQRYPTYREIYLIAAPLMFPSNMGPNRHPHIAREYPQR